MKKGNLVFAFNFHPEKSFDGYPIPVSKSGNYKVVLSSDDGVFGGFDRVDKSVVYHTWAKDPQLGDGFSIYIPARTALVLRKV